MRPSPSLLVVFILLGAALARAQTPAAPKTLEDRTSLELDRELRHALRIPPATLELRFDGMDSTHYELLASHVEVDGQSVLPGIPKGAVDARSQVIFFGVVTPGQHLVSAVLTFKKVKGVSLFQYVEGYRFKLPARFVLNAQRGLVLSLRLRVHADEATPMIEKRLQIVATLEPRMVAKLEDDSMPEAPKRPVLATQTPAPAAPSRKRASKRSAAVGKAERPFTRMSTGRWKVRKVPADARPEVSTHALKAALEQAREESPEVTEVSGLP